MHRSFHYHAEAEHARRLAETAIQSNVKEELRRVAEEFDRLADDFAASEVEFHQTEILEHSSSVEEALRQRANRDLGSRYTQRRPGSVR